MLTGRHVRTRHTPIQPIPLFTDLLDILMAPGNERVKLNVSLPLMYVLALCDPQEEKYEDGVKEYQ